MFQRIVGRITKRHHLLERAAAHWSELARERQSTEQPPLMGWLDSVEVGRRYLNPQMGAPRDAPEDWFTLTRKRYFPVPVARALSIGCGNGYLERAILQQNVARDVDGVDLSPGAIASAQEQARRENLADHVRYSVADLNTHTFPAGIYDAVFAAMALHHVQSLEFHLDQVRKTLKPGALFVLNEFVGPNQFQWTDKQLEWADAALQKIPEVYRRRSDGSVHEKVVRPTIEEMNRIDPTESVRSSEIIPLVLERFDLVERVDYGGTLLHLVLNRDVLSHMLGNPAAAPDKRGERDADEVDAVLETLFETERQAIRSGALSSDFCYMVVRKPA